jgi:hypothetical protein
MNCEYVEELTEKELFEKELAMRLCTKKVKNPE